MIIEVAIFLLTFIVLLTIILNKRDSNLPPGPWFVPLLGNLPILYNYQAKKLRVKYGDIFSTRMGSVRMIYIIDYKMAKEAFSKIEFANRPVFPTMMAFKEEKRLQRNLGVVMSNGSHWHNSRRFLLRHLRDLGMGKSKIEGIIMREVELLVEDFTKLTNEPNDLPFSTNIIPLNVIWQLLTGKRYELGDKVVREFSHKIEKVNANFALGNLAYFFPILNNSILGPITNYLVGANELVNSIDSFTDLVQPEIDEHLEKLDVENPKDLIDDYLTEMALKRHNEYSHFSNDDLLRTTFDLFAAGNETTAVMTRWTILYLAKYQHIQTKVQEIIDEFVPRDSLPGLEHRERLSYLDATINEVQRLASLTPFGFMRETTSDVTFKGYFIPKDSLIFAGAEMNHHDPKYWENPKDLNPENFLDSNGKFLANKEGFQPFGFGKRQCLGENFARMELFLILASLIQRFTFAPPEGQTINLNPEAIPVMNRDQKQKVSIKLRY